jgi:hypothetical protein
MIPVGVPALFHGKRFALFMIHFACFVALISY